MLREVGPYRLLKKLGAGGMGEVHLAQHVRHGQRCALKLLRLGEHPEDALRFAREGQAHVAAGVHPHVVEIYELGQDRGWSYIALELVEGDDLAGRLQQGQRLDPAEARRICQEACRGVEHLHRLGVLHRDLKPANVLLSAHGRAKVTDFGLARLSGADTLTQTGELLGTPVYMAPEQARGEVGSYGPATDVYGLGGVLYACLTGRPPTTSRGTLYATLAAINDELPPPPSTINPEVPPWLDAVCQRALAKDPEERYASAGELAEALAGPGSLAPGKRGSKVVLAPALMLGALAFGYLAASLDPVGQPSAPGPPAASAEVASSSPGASPAHGPASEDLVARCERMVREIAAADPKDRVALQLELLRLCHQRHQVALLKDMTRALGESKHALEAAYRLADATASSADCAEAHETLRRLEARRDAWGVLARARLKLEGAMANDEARQQIQALERSLRGAPGPQLATLLQEARELIVGPMATRERPRVHLPKAPNVRALLPAAQALAYGRPGSEGDAELERVLKRARDLCRPHEPPPELRALGLRLEAERGLAPQEFLQRAQALAQELSPWRRARLLIVAGSTLEQKGEPLSAFRLWQGVPAGQARAWLSILLQKDSARAALRSLALRLERASGQPLGEPLPEDAQEFVAQALEDMPPEDRPLARRALELAASGGTWSQLQPEVEELLTRGREGVLLALELMLGRDQLERAFRTLERTRGQFGEGAPQAQRARLGLLLVAFTGSEAKDHATAPAHVEALLRGARWARLGAPADRDALREALRPAREGPPWARRLAAFVTQLNYPQAARLEGLPLPGALYGRAYFFEQLQALRVKRDLPSLERAARALRVTDFPASRIALAQVTLAELPAELRTGFARSVYLWLSEARATLREPAWKGWRKSARKSLLLVSGLLRLHDGGSAEEVSGIWREALGSHDLPTPLKNAFQARFGEPYTP